MDIGQLVYGAFGIAVTIIGYFIARALKQVDQNQTKLWEHMDLHEKRLSTLEGEHNAFTGKGKHP